MALGDNNAKAEEGASSVSKEDHQPLRKAISATIEQREQSGFPQNNNGDSAKRDVIPPNFIQAIEALTNSTNTLTETYTGSLNFLIDAVKEV